MSKNKTFRDKLETQLSELAEQTDELRKQVVERAPGVRDQIVEQSGELAKQVAERAPVVRDQIIAALPDRDQLIDLRDDLFERLPENVQEKLPEKVKPKRKRLRRVAAIGLVTGAGAAAFAIVRRRGAAIETTYVAPTPPTPPAPPVPPAAAAPTAPVTAADVAEDAGPDASGQTPKH